MIHFHFLIDKFYEKKPEYKEKKIKNFSINGNMIKMDKLIKEIELDNCPRILIEY